MKKVAAVFVALIMCTCVFLVGFAVYALVVTPADHLPRDKVASKNVNVILSRPQNWQRFVTVPPVNRQALDAIDGSTATIPITCELYRQFFGLTDDEVADAVMHSSTNPAYLNLIDGYRKDYRDNKIPCNLILVTYPSKEEQQRADNWGVPLDITPIARDGFVFIVNKDNPLDSLTAEQVRGIYTGKYTNWSQLGGDDRPIEAYQREPNSGSQTGMQQLVMQGEPMITPIPTMVEEAMGSLVDAVAEYGGGAGAIGYTYDYYIKNLYRNDNVKVLKINGIKADSDSYRSGSYPFTTCYYAVIRASEGQGTPARILRDWLVSGEGQRLIESAGYCRM